MTDDQLLLDTAKFLRKVPYNFVGAENAKKMLDGIQQGKQPESIVGSEEGRLNMDFAGAAIVLGAVLLQLKTILEIVKLLKETFGRKPTVEEVKREMPKQPGPLTDEEIAKVIETFIDHS
jgi:hypothetical protein